MQSVSRKTVFTDTFSSVLDAPEFKNCEICFVTAAGIISGTQLSKDEKNPVSTMYSTIVEAVDKRLREHSETIEIKDDAIALKNVKVQNGAAVYNLDHLVLFTDQIIGVTFG